MKNEEQGADQMRKSMACVVIAGILWGIVSIFVAGLQQYGFHPVQIAAVRNSVAAVFVIGFTALFAPAQLKTRWQELLLFAISGICLFATAGFYQTAMQLTSVSTAAILLYTSPALVMVLSILFLKERFTYGKLAAVLVAMLGASLVSGVVGGVRFQPTGIAIGILSSIAYSIYNICVKIEMRRGNHIFTANAYSFLFAALTGILCSHPIQAVKLAYTQWDSRMVLLMAGIGILCSAVPYFLYTISMKRLTAGVAASMAVIEPMTAAVIGVIVFQETLSVFAIIGIGIILASIVVLSRIKKETVKR